jgi:hypothetical protein
MEPASSRRAIRFCVDVFDIPFYDRTIAPLHAAQTYTIEVSHSQ